MLLILILSCKPKDVTNFMFYIVWEIQTIVLIFATRCPVVMSFEYNCSILCGQEDHTEKSELNGTNM